MPLPFSIQAKHPRLPARVGKFLTAHGEVTTPVFMPVATRAFFNHMNVRMAREAGSSLVLGGNTYHMLVAPGLDTIQALGGMHRMMAWDGPMLTDSGGYQVFSLSRESRFCKIDEEGATFKHPTSGALLRLSPALSIAAQKIIGADIIMAFDECTPESGGYEAAVAAMERTHRWLAQSKEAHEKQPETPYGFKQALFGIIQGGRFQDLREQSTERVLSLDFDGIAIGGEVVGYDMAQTVNIIDWVRPHLPEARPRYTMGVGLNPQDLIDVVARGIDMFDCVAPTRNARHGALYCGRVVEKDDWVAWEPLETSGRILIKKSLYARSDEPIVRGCACYTCQHYSRGYLHHLFKQSASLCAELACIHNVHTMHEVCRKMRERICR